MVRLARWLLMANAAMIGFSLAGTASRLFAPGPDWDYATIASVMAIANITAAALASLLLLARSQGWASAVALLALCTVIAGGLEYLSTITGFPFGPYQYTGALGPLLLGRVPLLIPIAWFMMMYPALQMGHLLRLDPVRMGLFAGAMLTAWDLALDPAMTTGFAAWTWEHSGWYYDIPPQNFPAWFATAWVIGTVHAAWGPRWRADRSRLPALLFALQFLFAGILAALSARPGALVAGLAGLGSIALVVRGRLRRIGGAAAAGAPG